MKIYYLTNKNIVSTIPVSQFTGIVSIDIGYRTCGLAIIETSGKFKTFDIEPIKFKINLAKLSIPDYYQLSIEIGNYFKTIIAQNPFLREFAWSMEIPNIMGCYAPALSILLSTISSFLLQEHIKVIFYTGNRLGGYFLKKRKYTKAEIKNLVKDRFCIENKITDHEADALLQAYSIYHGFYKKELQNVQLREFTVELQELNNGKDK